MNILLLSRFNSKHNLKVNTLIIGKITLPRINKFAFHLDCGISFP